MDETTRSCARHSEDAGTTMGDVIAARYRRRDLLKGALAATAISATLGPLALAGSRKAEAATTRFAFTELEAGVDENHHVAPGYRAQVLVRWGDPVLPDAPAFDPMAQTADAQARQFGYNNDFLAYIPLEGSSEHGLLVVNHEYTNEELMFPGMGGPQEEKEMAFRNMTPELAAIEMMAHGGSVLEVRKVDGAWQVVPESRYARRITAETPMEITGPAAGAERMRTKADPAGAQVLGMLNNCAGGVTPWGTWLSAEENFHGYFQGKLAEGHPQTKAFKRYGVPGGVYNWASYQERFDLTKEPNEANRFGWMVEIDPHDPNAVPKKRTALGRMKHEGAGVVVNKDGRVVVYMGDDERFDYVYRFVTAGTFNPNDRAANMGLLDEGTLSVARYNADGSLDWLPLVHGQGALTEAAGFTSQADVLIDARLAGDAVGATKMDRPEDIDVDPRSNRVYLMLTNNDRRKPEQVDAANPRAANRFGHIVEMIPPDGDHAASRFAWEVLLRCGDPSAAEAGATFTSATTRDGWFGMPDNCAFDGQGRLWVATDGNTFKATGRSDGVWAVETEGEARGTSRHFFRVPVRAELCGPTFTPDDRTLFVAIQHPAEEDRDGNAGSFENPPTRWPDFKEGMPARPSIVVITKEDGGIIGA